MKTIQFHGSSDDAIIVQDAGETREFPGDEAYFLLRERGNVLGVRVKFGKGACWHAFPFIVDDDAPRLVAQCTTDVSGYPMDYSTTLILVVPEDTTIQHFLEWKGFIDAFVATA